MGCDGKNNFTFIPSFFACFLIIVLSNITTSQISLWHGSFCPPNTVACRYNAVQYNMIFHMPLHWLMQNIDKSLDSQKTLHTSPSRASYQVSIERNLEKIDPVIAASHCTHKRQSGLRWDMECPLWVDNLSYIIRICSSPSYVYMISSTLRHDFWPLTMISNDLKVFSDVFLKSSKEKSIVEEIELIMGTLVNLYPQKSLTITCDFWTTNPPEWTPFMHGRPWWVLYILS